MDIEAASDAIISSSSSAASSSSDEGIGAARILAFKAKVRIDVFLSKSDETIEED